MPAAVRRSTLGVGAAGPHRLSVAADNAGMGGSPWAVNRHSLATRGRRSSVAPSRLSGTGKMLSRLSVGLTDALQWLGIRGKIPAAGAVAALTAEAGAAGAAAADRPALSPIASPGGEEGGSEAGDSPLAPQSVAVTALEQLPADSSAVAPSPVAAEVATEQADVAEGSAEEQDAAAAAVAASPLPAATPGGADEAAEGAAPSEEEAAAAEAAAEVAAAEPEAAPASPAVEALRHELEAKLQLQEEQQASAQLEEPAAEAEAAEEEEEAEELTPLQQLLVLCGQEVRWAVGMAQPWRALPGAALQKRALSFQLA